MNLGSFARILRSASGLSLMEMMFGMGILGVAITGVLTVNQMQQKALIGNRTLASRDQLKSSIERYLLDPQVIAKSAQRTGVNNSGNQALKYCLSGPPDEANASCAASVFPKCCEQRSESNPQHFYLLDPADPKSQRAIAGTTADPARFSVDGAPCASATASATCPIEVVSSYVALCADGSDRCRSAEKIFIRYSIKKADGVKLDNGTFLKTVEGVIPVSSGGSFTLPAGTSTGGTAVGGSGLRSPLRFTRTKIIYTSTPEQKDALCRSDLGEEYIAATLQDVMANWAGNLGGNPAYESSNGSWRCWDCSMTVVPGQAILYPAPGLSLKYSAYQYNGTLHPVACIHEPTARLRFTRTPIANDSTLEQKDNHCKNELKSDHWQAASQNDILANWNGSMGGDSQYNSSNGSWYCSGCSLIAGNGGVYFPQSGGNGVLSLIGTSPQYAGKNHPLACIVK